MIRTIGQLENMIDSAKHPQLNYDFNETYHYLFYDRSAEEIRGYLRSALDWQGDHRPRNRNTPYNSLPAWEVVSSSCFPSSFFFRPSLALPAVTKISRKIKIFYCTNARFVYENVNGRNQLMDGDWLVPYTPTLEHCWDRLNPAAMVTVQGRGTVHDYVQLGKDFYTNYISWHTEFEDVPKGLELDKYEKARQRAWGETPVDIVYDASHMIVRAVSRLYLYAYNFASRLKCACLSVQTNLTES